MVDSHFVIMSLLCIRSFSCITSRFVTDDNFFVFMFSLSLLIESSLHRVFLTWFLLIVCFCFVFGLCLRVFSFALYFRWMGSLPWFWFTGFFFFWTLLCQWSDTWGERVTQNWKQKGICLRIPLFSLSQKRLKNDVPLFVIISSLVWCFHFCNVEKVWSCSLAVGTFCF